MGGDSPIPTAFVEMQTDVKRANLIARAKNDKASQNLLDEIERLREKYRAQQSRGASAGNNVVVPTLPQVNQVNQFYNRPVRVTVPTMPNRAGLPVPTQVLPTVNNAAYPARAPLPRANQAGIPINVPTVPRANNAPFQVPFPRANQAGIPINVPRANEPVNPQWDRFNNNNTRNARNQPPTGIADANQPVGMARGTQVSPVLPNSMAAVDRYLPQVVDDNTPGAPGTPGGSNSAGMIWPAKGTFTSGYGWRWGRMHRGIDIAAPTGTPIYAVADGVVEKAGWNNGGFGNLVEVRHADGTMTRYAHNSRILVQTGQQVRQGQNISLMGSTGFSTGPHLHFEIHRSGKGAVNPIAFLPQNRM
ncbi:MAG: M23 family metallopeptidase [Calothrix sp. SM1_7_51]|nr:M23 family metallopeptidase [Calothrix sp. SM1_7_51]